MLPTRGSEIFGTPPRVTRQAHLLKDIFSVRVEVFLLVEVGILDDELECSYCGHTTQDFAGVEVHMSVVPEPSTIEPSIFLLLLLLLLMVPPEQLMLDSLRSSERRLDR